MSKETPENLNNEQQHNRRWDDQQASEEFRQTIDWIVVVLALLFGVIFFSGGLYYLFIVQADWLIQIIKDHFNAIVMPPLAMTSSIFVVSILKIASGPVKLNFLGMQFEGSSAPIVMYLAVFSSFIISINMMW